MGRAQSVPNEQHPFQRQLQPITRIESVKEPSGSLEVVCPSIVIAESHGELGDPVHHAGLEQVLKELVVHDSTAGLDLQDKAGGLVVGVRLEGLLELPVEPEEDGDLDLLPEGLAGLDAEPEIHERPGEGGKDSVARQVVDGGVDFVRGGAEGFDHLEDQRRRFPGSGVVEPVDHENLEVVQGVMRGS